MFFHKNWQRTDCRQQTGSSLMKIGNGKIRDLTGDFRFPEVDLLE